MLATLVAGAVAFGASSQTTGKRELAPIRAGLPAFCAFQPKGKVDFRFRENTASQSLSTLISLPVASVRIEWSSGDWKDAGDARDRVLEVLSSKPGELASGRSWAEAEGRERRRVVASLDDRRSMRIDIAGNHVCVQDANAQTWFFRTVDVDGWRK